MQTLQLQLKQKIFANQEKITRILGWTELQYSNFIYETGLRYLELYIPTDRAGIDALSRSKIFWIWWRNHWAIRDAKYMGMYYSFSSNNWQALYEQEHSPETLTASIYPNAIVLNESYAVMIDHFNKSVV